MSTEVMADVMQVGEFVGETGFFDVTALGGQILDTLNGGPQKRERAAKAEQAAAEAAAQAAATNLQAQRESLAHQLALTQTAQAQAAPANFLTAQTAGLPHWAWGLGAIAIVGAFVYAKAD